MQENITSRITEKMKVVFEKLKKDKKALMIIVTGVLGMLLIMLSGSGEQVRDNETDVCDNNITSQTEIKNEVEDLIQNIQGAGKTQIMITYKSAEETIYAVDTEEQTEKEGQQIKREHIIVENNSGEGGLPVKIIYPEVQGVAVICEGGDDPIVKEKIYSLLSALFNINSNSISVAAMA